MDTPIMTALRLHAADQHLTLLSSTPAVADYNRRYFGSWWKAFEVPAATAWTGPLLAADVNEAEYAGLRALVEASPHEKASYARAETLVAHDATGTITAVSPGPQLAYLHHTLSGYLSLRGTDAEQVGLASARIARDTLRGLLLADGWTLLHASAAVRDGQAVLTFGAKGAGKTTTALALATRGWQLLANDRVFVRPTRAGHLDVLPWPSAAAIGLGLLDALGWCDIARTRLHDGDRLHPTQHPEVTQALMTGRRTPLWESDGRRERKAHIFPDQFNAWFGLDLATEGRAATVLFPQIDPSARPAALNQHRALGDEDFMHGATEDRYPDILGLAPTGSGSDHARQAVAAHLAQLPHCSVRLGHDLAANADFLAHHLA
ncbi:hypothetical protein OKJ48_13525 [Streptomyces kunmingensis]|uniref:HprK-related kinase B n=1 Tax=Streptomyces kunmingensis TaxID=68225 RepID=A0ABU6CA78_9ACTN|nr:hypothetical protein [Streptomyces kunmingensis]MEB3961260.1 hypothetical protein [Streptomyces kunmingensis]